MIELNVQLILAVLLLGENIHGNPVHHDDIYRSDYTFSEEAYGWYKLHFMPTTWLDARLLCKLEGANVASPTVDHIHLMIEVMKRFSINSLYTGISAIYASGVFTTIEGTPIESNRIPKSWALGQPDNIQNNENCITINHVGLLADDNCNSTFPFMCFKRKTNHYVPTSICGPTDNGYRYETSTQSCYKVHEIARTFSGAYLTCQAEGGHLAIINSDTESEVIKHLVNEYQENQFKGSNNNKYYFLGYHKDWNAENGYFVTIHGQTMEEAGFNRFLDRQPDNAGNKEYCITVFRDSGFNDANCEERYGYVCEMEPVYLDVVTQQQ